MNTMVLALVVLAQVLAGSSSSSSTSSGSVATATSCMATHVGKYCETSTSVNGVTTRRCTLNGNEIPCS